MSMAGPARSLASRRQAASASRGARAGHLREVRHELRAIPPVRVMSQAPFVVLTSLVIVGGVLGLLALNVAVNQQAFQIAELERANHAAEERYGQQLSEVNRLRSLSRIEREARKLGMVPADRVHAGTWPGTSEEEATSGAVSSPAAPGALPPSARERADAFSIKRHLAVP